MSQGSASTPFGTNEQNQETQAHDGLKTEPPTAPSVTPAAAYAPALPPASPIVFPIQQQLQLWNAPYPPPEAVKQYEEVLPGAFDRIIRMAELAQTAQIDATKRALDYAQRDTKRGHWLGFFATVLAMGFSFGCAWIGQPWVAAVFLGVPVMAVGKALIESATATPQTTAQTFPIPQPGPPPSPPQMS
jgi:uncharacterized membrane protein